MNARRIDMKILFVLVSVFLCSSLDSAQLKTEKLADRCLLIKYNTVVWSNDVDKFNEARSECNLTFPTSSETESHLVKLGTLPDESDKTPMCFIHCVMEKTGMVNEEGAFVPETLVETLKSFPNGTEIEHFDKTVEKCVEENNQEDHCDKAYGFAKCLMTEEIHHHHKDE